MKLLRVNLLRIVGCTALGMVALLLAAGAGRMALAKDDKPAANVADQQNSCITCHGDPDIWEGDRLKYHVTEKQLSTDIHWQKGLHCQDCHGGDPTKEELKDAHDLSGAGLRSIKAVDIPVFCGQCHGNIEYMKRHNPSLRTDQLTEYWTSGHGQHLKKGDTGVATCISCHSHHGIRAVADLESPVYRTHVAETCSKCHSDEKLMAGRMYHDKPMPHNQYELWKKSVHAEAMFKKGDVSAATCNNCHGNHGAVPPQIDSVANACGACHGKIASLFAQTQMRHKFETVGLPGCATCHSNHNIGHPSDVMLGMEEGAVCAKCHTAGKFGAPLAGAEVARAMRKQFEDFKDLIKDAKEKVAEAETKGMEVSGPRFDLHKATDILTKTRVLVHSFKLEPVKESLIEGTKVATEVRDNAQKALEEYRNRRVWLGTSLLPIVLVIGVLLLYIRQLPKSA